MNTHICPVCNHPIPADAPGGLCPACVLRDAGESAPAGRAAPSLEEIAPAFPQLEVLAFIGRGGMGFVYQVRQPNLDRTAALKILSLELGRDPAFAERFAREARVLGKLSHPNIVTVFEHGESGGFFYLLMEFVDGVNLRQAMRAGRFTPEQALAIVPGICDALQAAHAQGVWHRDIKPENILLDARGGVKIADFGIARIVGDPARDFTLTATGGALGSAAYMAPEQHEKPHDVDHRADIYSLGVVIYEMLTGELPLGRFPAPSQRAAVSARIDEIVLRTLEKQRELRQQSAAEVKTDVTGAAAGAGVRAAGIATEPAALTLWSIGLMVGGILLIVAAVVFTFGSTQGVLLAFACVAWVLGFATGWIALSRMRHGRISPGWRLGLRALVWSPVIAVAVFVIVTPAISLIRSQYSAREVQAARQMDALARSQAEQALKELKAKTRPPAPDEPVSADEWFAVEQRIILPGDAVVRVLLSSSVKGGERKLVGTPVIFKMAPDRATGFVLKWRASGGDRPDSPGRLRVDFVDPDTRRTFHQMSTGFDPPVRLSSPDQKVLPAGNDPIQITKPGSFTTFKLLRAEPPSEPGAPVDEWQEIFAAVTFVSPRQKSVVPEFQLPPLPNSDPRTSPPNSEDGH